MVVTWQPSAWTASRVQLLALWPSTWTVQAPHWLVSQPTCVPVRLRCSRRKWTRSSLGSTSAFRTLPLTVIETCAMGSLGTCFAGLKPRRHRRGVGQPRYQKPTLVEQNFSSACWSTGLWSTGLKSCATGEATTGHPTRVEQNFSSAHYRSRRMSSRMNPSRTIPLLFLALTGATLCVVAQTPATPPRPTPPTRDPHTPGYVAATELPDGTLPPVDAEGNFIVGPTHNPAPETLVQDG